MQKNKTVLEVKHHEVGSIIWTASRWQNDGWACIRKNDRAKAVSQPYDDRSC
ncbi:hypothetical protein GCM10007199_28790 [Fictibacillus barbaricus]|nr:hypothetical protein GCM10007199_28790 [Fictibacillus barbaricus]